MTDKTFSLDLNVDYRVIVSVDIASFTTLISTDVYNTTATIIGLRGLFSRMDITVSMQNCMNRLAAPEMKDLTLQFVGALDEAAKGVAEATDVTFVVFDIVMQKMDGIFRSFRRTTIEDDVKYYTQVRE